MTKSVLANQPHSQQVQIRYWLSKVWTQSSRAKFHSGPVPWSYLEYDASALPQEDPVVPPQGDRYWRYPFDRNTPKNCLSFSKTVCYFVILLRLSRQESPPSPKCIVAPKPSPLGHDYSACWFRISIEELLSPMSRNCSQISRTIPHR